MRKKPFALLLTLCLLLTAALGLHAQSGGGTVAAWGYNSNGQTTVPDGLTNVTAIAAGCFHTVALKSDGTVVAWGDNGSGETTVPDGLSGVTAIAAGKADFLGSHTVALKSDGTVVAWGENNYGETTIPAGLSNVTAIAAGGYHTVALKSDGTVAAWGRDVYGEANVPDGLSGVTAIAAGLFHTVALKNDGTVVAWGYNYYGQTTVPDGLTNVTAIAAGFYHTLALKSDGTVAAWGYNSNGQTTVPDGLTNVTTIAAGGYHSLALKADGTVVGWGYDGDGEIDIPVDLTGVMAIAAGGYHTVAILNAPPAIIQQPLSVTLVTDSTTTFNVTVIGSLPLSYQWSLNGTNVVGATNTSLMLTRVQFNQAGEYAVLVTNLYGLVLSSNAVLTVKAPAVFYVDLDCTNPVPPYMDWSTAATNIQDAIDAAIPGDQILVTNGVYQTGGRVVYGSLTNRVVIDKAVTVQSVNGPAVTVIEGYQVPTTTVGDSAVRCVYLTNNAVLAGFTLTNGATRDAGDGNLEQSGGGAWCESTNACLTNCVFTANAANNSGGGIVSGTLFNCTLSMNTAAGDGGGAAQTVLNQCILNGNSTGNNGGGAAGGTLNDCLITNNVAWTWNGGGASGSTLNRCTLTGNSALYGGGAVACTANNCTLMVNGAAYGGGADGSDLNNCLVVSNSVGDTGAGAFDSTLNNCTVWGNTASDGTGGIEGCVAHNCIILGNDHANYRWGSLDYCCTEPLPGDGSGNFNSDPLLIDPLGGDFHLQSNSPCVNQGNNADVASTTDLDGNPRIFDGTVDVGAYELQTPVPLQAMIHPESTNAVLGYDLNLTGSTLGGIGTTNSWDFGDGTGASNQWSVAHTWATAGDYPVTLTVFNDANPGGVNATIIIHVSTQILYYVDANGTNPVAPYSSWDKAAMTIQNVVDIAMAGATVVVTDGVYAPFGGNKPLNIQSVNGPATTMVDGGGAQRCVYLAGGATLSGFMLTNGTTWDNGGGVFCEAATTVVSNCVFVGNSARSHSGGGAFGGTLNNCILTNNVAYAGGAASYCALSNCVLIDNSAEEAGGAYFCSLNNCTVTGNSAADVWGGACGELNNCLVTSNSAGNYAGGADGVLNNCIIAYNSASYGGGGNGTLNNCTLVGNTANQGGAAYESELNNCIVYYNSAPSGPNALYCSLNYCATPTPGGPGNITNEPVFVNLACGDFHLQSNSPCINAGNNAYVSGANDLDGNPRIKGDTVDIGAYEYQTPTSVISYAWLQQYSLPTDGSADFIDSDGDGMNNWREWRTGTDPTNPQSVLMMTSVTATNSPPGMVVTWQSVSGITYFLQSSTNLGAQPAFSTIQSNIVGQAGTTSYTDTTATNAGPYFYHVGVQ